MSGLNSALASLTATYTDSENEDEHNSGDESADSKESQVIIPSRPSTPIDETSQTPPAGNTKKQHLRLVSYNDDLVISDDDMPSPDDSEKPEVTETPTEPEIDELQAAVKDRSSEYGFNLPPEPKGKCAPELQEKINTFYERMRTHNLDMTRVIEERKDFRNPSIYEKLIQFCDIDEFGTNYPPEIYDPLRWGDESYYEELDRVQKMEMEKREQEKKETSKLELASLAAKKAEEEAKKRKSKWDQPAPVAGSGLKPAVLVQPSLTSNVTGTKGTIISAFGSLPKKPKP